MFIAHDYMFSTLYSMRCPKNCIMLKWYLSGILIKRLVKILVRCLHVGHDYQN